MGERASTLSAEWAFPALLRTAKRYRLPGHPFGWCDIFARTGLNTTIFALVV